MSVIDGQNYKAIADAYGHARTKMTEAVAYFYTAVYTIVLLNDIVPTVDLLGEFYTSYLINDGRLNSTVGFDSSVRQLQSHVVKESTEKDLNDYLDAHVDGLGKVPQAWADLSAAVGFTIDSDHIA